MIYINILIFPLQCICDSPLLLHIIVICLFLLLDIIFRYESITIYPLYHWQIWVVSTLGVIYSSIYFSVHNKSSVEQIFRSKSAGLQGLFICSTWAYSMTQQRRICLQCGRHRRHRVWPLGGKDLLEKGMATHSSILAWRIPWAE